MLETLGVYFEQTRVGSLGIDDERRFSFQYSKEWLASTDAFQISISLPMQEDVFSNNKVKSFFSNLLPESAVRELIARRLGISSKNDFMLLKRIGGECAGAITILPESETPESPDQYKYRLLSGEQLADLIKDIPRRPLLAGEEGIRISLAGAQEKLSLFYKDPSFYIPKNGAPSNSILKPGMAHYQYSIENECFCMMLAKAVDLNVPLVKIVQKDTQKVLVIKRYFLKTKIPVKSALPKKKIEKDLFELPQETLFTTTDRNRPKSWQKRSLPPLHLDVQKTNLTI